MALLVQYLADRVVAGERRGGSTRRRLAVLVRHAARHHQCDGRHLRKLVWGELQRRLA